MPHPENAYAFNEHSLRCCGTQVGLGAVVQLVDLARAWRLHESGPLINRLKQAEQFDTVRRSARYRDKLEVLLMSAVNRPHLYDESTKRLQWHGDAARGMTVAHRLGGFIVSWPCGCAVWREALVEATAEQNGATVPCRNVASESHLRTHWLAASRQAKRQSGRPCSVQRVDNAQNTSGGEVPQIHFKDGSALNIDGAWKHALRELSGDEEQWLGTVGWVSPNAPVEVR